MGKRFTAVVVACVATATISIPSVTGTSSAAAAANSILYPAGDFDGDGLNDVVEADYTSSPSSITARKGTDGTVLWRVTPPVAIGATPMTGANGKAVVLASISQSVYPPPLANNYTNATASVLTLLGSDGTQRWSRPGPVGISEPRRDWTDTVYPLVTVLEPRGSHGSDLVLTSCVNDTTSVIEVVDGTTGMTTGREVVTPFVLARIIVLPDLTSDGAGEFALVGPSGSIGVRDGITGKHVWGASVGFDNPVLAVVGDTSGDGVSDIGVYHRNYYGPGAVVLLQPCERSDALGGGGA